MILSTTGESDAGQLLSRLDLAAHRPGRPEAWLQDRLFRSPELLLGAEIDPLFADLRPIAKEFLLSRGDRQLAVDILALSPLGGVTLVEVKLGRNTEARRAIVAQALAYAGALRHLGRGGLAGALHLSPEELHERVGAPAVLDPAGFAETVDRNIARGRVLLLLALDRVGAELDGLVADLRDMPGLPFEIAILEVACRQGRAGSGEILFAPRLRHRMRAVERAVLRIEESGAAFEPIEPVRAATLTEDEFLMELGRRDPTLVARLPECLAALASAGAVVRFGATMQLRGEMRSGDEVMLGYVDRAGILYVYPATSRPVAAGHEPALRQYLADVAALVGGEAVTRGDPNGWCVKRAGKTPRLLDIMGRGAEFGSAIRQLLGH